MRRNGTETSGVGVLLTGFGPFPGVDSNLSFDFARDLGTIVSAASSRVTVNVMKVDTVWASASERIGTAITTLRPDIVLMFGVARHARGLVIERRAVNICAHKEDADGRLPESAILDADDRAERLSTLPMSDIQRQLMTAPNTPAHSNYAGRYLCNALLFHALKVCECHPNQPLAGFIHLPLAFATAAAYTDAQTTAARLIDIAIAHRRHNNVQCG